MPPRRATARNATAVQPRRSSGLGKRRGGLKGMLNMPLDILLEIVCWLHPRDLLNLARSTKAFRELLLSRSAAPLWKKARETVEGLPECPSYLSEPAYANLLFFPHCHHCLKPNIQQILFEFSVRYCKACKKMLLLDYQEAASYLEGVKHATGYEGYVLNCVVIGEDPGEHYFHEPELNSSLEVWSRFGWNDRDAKTRFAEEKLDAVDIVEEACEKLYAWRDAQAQAKADELENLRAQRLLDIQERLREEGWGDQLDCMNEDDLHAFRQEPYVRKPTRLTEKAWAKIRLDALSYMRRMLRTRIRQDPKRRDVLIARFRELKQVIDNHSHLGRPRVADDDLGPQFVDLAFTPPAMAIIGGPEAADDSTRLEAMFDTMAQVWMAEREEELTAMLKKAMPDLEGVDKPLELALAAFSCVSCSRKAPLRWPALLVHPCTRGQFPACDSKDIYMLAIRLAVCGTPHSLRCLEVNTDTTQNLRAVMTAYGLDPLMTTQEQLDKEKRRLTCASCVEEREDGHRVEAFDWLRALLHCNEPAHRDNGVPCRFKLLDEKESKAVRLEEVRMRGRRDLDLPDHYQLGCKYCPRHWPHEVLMISHLKEQHGIDIELDADLPRHSYIDLDSESRRVPPIHVRVFPDGGRLVQGSRAYRR